MSRGHGRLQSWLLAHVPETGTGADTETLAVRYFGARPTAAELSSVRRALRRLEAEGHVFRVIWSDHQGRPSSWLLS